MMRIIQFYTVLLLTALCPLSSPAQQSLSIVPYPKTVTMHRGALTLDQQFTVGYLASELAPLAELFISDLHTRYQLSPRQHNDAPDVLLGYDASLAEEAYTIEIGGSIVVKGGSYRAVSMGVTSLLQLARPAGHRLAFPKVSIADHPTSTYRGVMLDVARQWHHIETVKQVVDLCRWYKISYLQLHLADDQLFTFPSSAFPQLASPQHYTLQELKDLVAYAEERGVVIIPELDAPGHTGAMRRNMPELFGHPDLGVLDMTNEKVYAAMETLIKEMIDVFHTSPYFHIGADEAWLGEFEKAAHTAAYITEKGFDNAHDVYLDFIVRMHHMVKKHDKKTLVWESFPGTGSRKVQVPKDLIVFAWETAYQRPESLLANGYTVINASWKPAYITPGLRWAPEYIYNWNIHRWENHWYTTPAYLNPIQLDRSIPILGGQLCAWEMSEEQAIPSLHQRVPAISEVLWNGDDKKAYADFRKRYLHTDMEYRRHVFPVAVDKKGFTEPDYEGIYYNRENNFADRASITFKPLPPGAKITYTTDGSTPTVHSPALPRVLTIDNDFAATLAVFDESGDRVGYKMVRYELNAIAPKITGDTLPQRDVNIQRPQVEFIDGITLSFDNLKKGSAIRYTTDGSTPSATSAVYSAPIPIDSSMTVKAVCYHNGLPFGKRYESEFVKKDFEANITTSKKIFPAKEPVKHSGNLEKVVDGYVDGQTYWDAEGNVSVIIDLGKATTVSELSLYTYWDDHRYYTYDVELSLDEKTWNNVIDRSDNKDKATKDGYRDQFPAQKARFIKVNMLGNSANNSMHIVEIRVY